MQWLAMIGIPRVCHAGVAVGAANLGEAQLMVSLREFPFCFFGKIKLSTPLS